MTSKDSNPFRPTHVITHQGEDWSFSRSGTLLFQGQVPAGEHSFQRIDR